MTALPMVPALMTFDEASALVLDFLKESVPLGFWSVNQHAGDRQVYLHVRDDSFGLRQGDSHAWSDSLCSRMAQGLGPQIAPDVRAVPAYAAAGITAELGLGAYVGVPIRGSDGQLFGTLCGKDPRAASEDFAAHAPVLRLLAALLGQILQADELSSEAAEREVELHRRAFHDDLTGLANRAMFLDRLAHALDLHVRDLRPVAVLLVDVDDFKAVNDTFGHAAGDELLIALAHRLRGVVRAGDTLARLGGDEFAVLVEDGGEAGLLAERAVAAVAAPFVLPPSSTDREVLDAVGAELHIGLSVGLAELAGDAPTPGVDAMLSRADVAMYTAKRGGKGRTARYDPVLTMPEGRDLQLREPLRRALAAGSVRTAYQPVVALECGRVIGFEALARWDHEGVPVPPSEFVPVAARGGLLPRLSQLMLDRAGEQLARWAAAAGPARPGAAHAGLRDLQVAVNVPATSITDPAFPVVVAAAVMRWRLDPGRLVLEITEDALLTDPVAARRVCAELHELGVLLSLDDFGTGYSSLLHLQQIPLDSVKIDQGFAADVDSNARTEQFMRALLAMGHDLGLRVVVEGVERRSQADVLLRLGATHAQGYLFGRPGPAEQLDLVLHPVPGQGGSGRTGGSAPADGLRAAGGAGALPAALG